MDATRVPGGVREQGTRGLLLGSWIGTQPRQALQQKTVLRCGCGCHQRSSAQGRPWMYITCLGVMIVCGVTVSGAFVCLVLSVARTVALCHVHVFHEHHILLMSVFQSLNNGSRHGAHRSTFGGAGTDPIAIPARSCRGCRSGCGHDRGW
jgi:hypothetical protein